MAEEQFAPALPVIPYDDIEEAVDAANDTSFGLCASVWSNDVALAADVASRLSAGTVFINAHGISAIDMYAPLGGWKQSGFGVELGPEGMQAFARQHVQVRRPVLAEPAQPAQPTEPAERASGVSGRDRRHPGGTVVDGTGAPAVRADVLVDDGAASAVGPDAAAPDVDTVIDAAARSSPPASSTCTRTTTRSSSGTPTPARRRCTA